MNAGGFEHAIHGPVKRRRKLSILINLSLKIGVQVDENVDFGDALAHVRPTHGAYVVLVDRRTVRVWPVCASNAFQTNFLPLCPSVIK